MRILALSSLKDLEACAEDYADASHDLLRPPETGLVMLRGRMGATGAAFNLGEATVTRCAVRLDDGSEGHAYVMGRSATHARLAAICDALLQRDPEGLSAKIIAPLATRLSAKQVEASTKAAATKVDFFTMVRGDD
jgi:alpha-D-ribose 1-methylphosphonate 5-triphosphate synthase subunit PhnG